MFSLLSSASAPSSILPPCLAVSSPNEHGLVQNDLIFEGCYRVSQTWRKQTHVRAHMWTKVLELRPPPQTTLLTTGPHNDVSGSLRLHFFMCMHACVLQGCVSSRLFPAFCSSCRSCVAVGVSGKPCSRGSAEEQVGLPVLWKRAALWPLEWVRSYFLLSCGLTLWEVWLLNEAPLLPPFSQAAWKLHQSCWRWNRMTVGAKSYIWMRFQRTCDP